MSVYAHLENTVLYIVAGLLAYSVSPWCLLILVFVNYPRKKENKNVRP